MKSKMLQSSALLFLCNMFCLLICIPSFSQNDTNKISVQSVVAGGVVYMLDTENGFGGGNVAASVGSDGILLVDDMFKSVTPKLLRELKKINDNAAVRLVINSHFHGDHIEGNSVLSHSSIIIAHENVRKRLLAKGSWVAPDALPVVTFSDKLTIYFNGEEIDLFHLANGHTDSDVFVYFNNSKVIHMGDTFFYGMFPAVYKEGGGNVMQLIANLEKILGEIPADVKVIPGHGALASKTDLANYVAMLKETTGLVSAGIKAGKSLQQLQKENVLQKYSMLGDGGAQTTDQYLAMLYKLLSQ
jgi:cyclase